MLKTEVDKINRVGAHAETEGMDKEMVKVLKLPAENRRSCWPYSYQLCCYDHQNVNYFFNARDAIL